VIAIRNVGGRAAKKIGHNAVAELQVVGPAQIGDRCERNHAAKRDRFLSGKPQNKVAARGVPGCGDALQIKPMLSRDPGKVRGSRSNVVKRPGPSAARISDAPVFKAPGRNAIIGQRRAEMPGMLQIVTRPPIAAMNHNDGRMRTPSRRQSQLAELEFVWAISNTNPGRGRRKIENALRGQRQGHSQNGAARHHCPPIIGYDASIMSSPPSLPPQNPPAKKTNVVIWILGGLAVLLFCGLLTCSVIGFLAVRAVKNMGFDAELMQGNPGLAMARMITAMNPALEIVSSDDRRRTVKVRDRNTGKVLSFRFDPDKKGMELFGDDGSSVKVSGDGSNGSVEIKSADGTARFGSGAGSGPPAWVPVYPATKLEGTSFVQTPNGDQNSFSFKTSDAPPKVIAYFQDKLKSDGFSITLATSSDEGGMLHAEDGSKHRGIVLTAGKSSGETTGAIIATENKK
jgi:hypothetical protein